MFKYHYIFTLAFLALIAPAVSARADALDDGLAAARSLLIADNPEDAAAKFEILRQQATDKIATSAADPHAHYILGAASMYLGDDLAAATSLDRAVRLDPRNITFALARAQLAAMQEKSADAISLYKAAAALDPKNLEAWSELATLQLQTGDLPAAQVSAQNAAALDPKDSRFPSIIGQAHQNKGNFTQALESYSLAFALAPDDFRLAAKLVQVNEALSKINARDAARGRAFALFRAGKVSALSFCREVFSAGKSTAMAFEYFDPPKSPGRVEYAFNIVAPDGKTVEKRVSMAIAPPGQLGYTLDAYTPTTHELLKTYDHEPTYEQSREAARQYLAGTLKPLSTEPMGSPAGEAK